MAWQDIVFGTYNNEIFLSIAIFVVRIFVGVLFVIHGFPKLFLPAKNEMKNIFKKIGVHPVLFDLVGLLEFIGGFALIFGFLTRIAAILFTLEMIGTTLLYVTILWKLPIPRGYAEPMFKATKGYMFGWELDTILIASCFAIALIGPGILSIDYLIWSTILS
jgi:putative oxidoreductase